MRKCSYFDVEECVREGCVHQQQCNLVAMCQLTHNANDAWESPYLTSYPGDDSTCTVFPFTYGHNEFVWKVDALSEFDETTRDGIVLSITLVIYRLQLQKQSETLPEAEAHPILQ